MVAKDDPVTDYEMADAMMRYGGSFVDLIGRAWHAGDDVNRARLLAAFPDYVAEYRELVRLKRAKARTEG